MRAWLLMAVAFGLEAALACGPVADGQPPCDVATYAAIMADCGPRVHECEGRAGPCLALEECEGRLREREARCLR